MKYSESVKPISYLESHTAKPLRDVTEGHGTMVITQDGKLKAVLQDITTYEQTQESLALLNILALGNQQIEADEVQPAKDVIKRTRNNRSNS